MSETNPAMADVKGDGRTETVRYIAVKEFQERGYLQEVNRLFFHALGMALEIRKDDDKCDEDWRIGGVLDYRDDPEGIYFADGVDPIKAESVERERAAKAATRQSALGYVIQPVGDGGGS